MHKRITSRPLTDRYTLVQNYFQQAVLTMSFDTSNLHVTRQDTKWIVWISLNMRHFSWIYTPLFLSSSDHIFSFNPLGTNFTKWSNTLKQFVGKLPTNCLSVFDHFVGLALKGLKRINGLWLIITAMMQLTLYQCY